MSKLPSTRNSCMVISQCSVTAQSRQKHITGIALEQVEMMSTLYVHRGGRMEITERGILRRPQVKRRRLKKKKKERKNAEHRIAKKKKKKLFLAPISMGTAESTPHSSRVGWARSDEVDAPVLN